MIKKNALIFSILIAMLLGVLVGAIINKNYTSTFADIKQNVVTANSSLPQKQQQFLAKQLDRDEKQQKKDASSPYSLLSDIFLRLIKMIIAPLVFSVLVVGVAKIGDFKTVGRMGIKTLVYFTTATLIALSIGLVIVNVFEPGKKIHIDMPEAGADSGVKTQAQTA
ncbi:MAG TPA: cation:dicarboxylase symporter family transporter, partial [Bacteroidia bacterium]|nr:cation:dicarboxylase symporter family transporter [Bacteroidia bacterium]